MKNKFKFVLAAMVMAGFFFSALRTEAYPPFVRKAEKFGAKDCLFCHTQAGGGEGWNERGSWMIAEKDKRKADSIDVEWLADYKPEETKKEGDPKEGEKKPTEKPPAEKPPAEMAKTTPTDHSAHNHAAAPKSGEAISGSPEVAPEKSAKSIKKTENQTEEKINKSLRVTRLLVTLSDELLQNN